MANLPPALAARLAKRGLLNKGTPQTQTPRIDLEEEVIAEDYDDVGKVEVPTYQPCETVRGCVNKYNIYHNCTTFCQKQFGSGLEDPPRATKRKFARLLKKYHLDSVWEQVWEPGLKTYYFWNVETDQVSWLPPSHPDAKISMPAERLRMLVRDDTGNSDESEADSDKEDEQSDDSDLESSSSSSNEENNELAKRMKIIKKRNNLDPMDPAAYSNIPRGKWSDGLKQARESNH